MALGPIVTLMRVLVQGTGAKQAGSPSWGDVDSAAVADRVKRDFVKKITNPFFSRCFRERVLDMEQSRVSIAFVASTRTRQRVLMSRLCGPEQRRRAVSLRASYKVGVAGEWVRSQQEACLPRGSGLPVSWRPFLPISGLAGRQPHDIARQSSLADAVGARSHTAHSATASGSLLVEQRHQRAIHVRRSLIAVNREGTQHG